MRGCRFDEVVPEGMDTRFGGIAIETGAVRVSGGTVHYGPGYAAAGVDLQA